MVGRQTPKTGPWVPAGSESYARPEAGAKIETQAYTKPPTTAWLSESIGVGLGEVEVW